MNYLFQCPDCKAYRWISGSAGPDPETGAIEFSEKDEDREKWLIKNEAGQTDEYEGKCEHDNAEVVDSEYLEPLMDDVF